MAQFKDLVVSGAARIVGTLYAGTIQGNITGTAKNADTATYDRNGNTLLSYIRGLSISGRVISYTKGDGSTQSITVPDTSIPAGTDLVAGLTKLYTDTGENNDGTITQAKLTELLAAKIGTSETAAAANKDGSGNVITDTYIKGLASSGTTVTFTKGDNSTGSFQTQDTTYGTGSSAEAGLTKLYGSKGTNTDGTMTQNAINSELNGLDNSKLAKSDGVTGFSVNGSTVTYTKGDGSTGSFQTHNTEYGNATTATAGIVKLADSTGQSEDDVMTQKAVSDALTGKVGTSQAVSSLSSDGTTVTYTKADGSTASFQTQDTTYGNATTGTAGLVRLKDSTGQSETDVMTQKAVSDALSDKAATSQAVSSLSSDGSTVTYTRVDGSTGSFQTQNTEYGSATTATAGIVKLADSTGQSEDDVMTQKAVTDALGGKVGTSQAVSSLSSSGTTVTYTKADGSTASIQTQDTTYEQATDSVRGIVKVSQDAGTSTEDVMSQNAVTTELNKTLQNASTVSGAMKFTKGDGSTFSVEIPMASSATDSTPGVMKLYGNVSSAANTDGAPSQAAVYNALDGLETSLTTMIGNIFSVQIYDNIDELPEVGIPKIFYFVPTSEPGEGNNYDEYIWISDIDPSTEEDNGYYELFGSCSLDLSDYYTSSEVDTAIGNATNDLVKTVSSSGTTVTFTKSDNSTFSIQTQDTTYSQFGLSSDGLVPGTAAGQTNYVLTGNGWAEKAPKATNADTATYATNAGTADVALTCVNAGTSSHATNADSATYATNAGTADYATNAGTAANATNADSATYATNAGTAANATNATNADTATYATNAGTAAKATNADTATYANNAGTALYATDAGTSVYSTNAGTSTRATNADTATYATNAGTAAQATNADTATYATNAGTAIRATNADTATYAQNASTATYANNAGAALNADNAGTATYATNASTADYASSANTAGYATNAGTASIADVATLDTASQNIAQTYIKGASISGTTITFTKGDGSTFSMTTQDNNTTYANMVPATSGTAGTAGLVPAPTAAQVNYVLTGGGWVQKVAQATNADSATYATNAGTALFAQNTGTVLYAEQAGSFASDEFNIDCGFEEDES